jgi:phosphopantetheine--protein transferase-like protein
MSAPKDLRGVVAQLCKCAPEEINDGFSLDVPALRGSLKKAVLIASIRRYLGQDCMAAAAAKTFGELEALVSGKAQPSTAAPETKPAVAPSAVEMPAASGVNCGMDIEAVAQLPETSDYAGHQFYRDSFSPEEIAYCAKQAKPRLHFAARWCAKEALKKCDPAYRDVRLSELELARQDSGAVSFRSRGEALPHAVSVSHTEETAAAVVMLARSCSCSVLPIAALVTALIALVLAGAALVIGLR